MTHFIVFMFALFTINAAHAEDIICDAGSYLNGTECVACPDGYPNSAPGSTIRTECYSNPKLREWTGTQITPNMPIGCADATYGECKIDACEYVAYIRAYGNTLDGVIKSGCETNNADCTKPILSVTAASGHIIDGTACTQCPAGTYSPGGNATTCIQCPENTYSTAGAMECTACPDDYPNSDAGATGKTECYSNTKIRDCSTSCALPHGCQAGFCGNATCDYVAYVGGPAWKPVDGTIKSGCKSCNDVAPISVKAIPGYRVNGLSCEICPAGTYSPGGDATTCDACPNGATTFAGATSRDECMRILNYLPTGQTTPAKIYMSMKQNTHPAFAAKIGDDVFYANMTPVESSSEPGLYVAYSNQSYIVQDNKIVFETVPFYVMTTDNVTSFSFSMTAMGDFTVDWGDGAVEKIIRDNTTRTQYSHTYDVAGAYKIVFDGRATGYSTQCSTAWLTHSAIGFYSNKSVAKIGGTLSKMFPTIDGVNPGFSRMFASCSNLTGQIPPGLFADFTGAPHSCMFQYTFNGTPNLTGPTARTANGTRVYDIEYNGEKWIDAYPDAFTDMYTGSGIDTNN